MRELRQAICLTTSLLSLWGCREPHQTALPRQPSQASLVPAQDTPIRAWSPNSSAVRSDTLQAAAEVQDHGANLDQGIYVEGMFRKVVGEVPGMGWFLASRFIAPEKHPRVYVWSVGSRITVARFRRAMTATEHERLTREHQLACDSKGPLAEYELPSATDHQIERAFYTARLPGESISVGLRQRVLQATERSAVRALLADRDSSALYRDTAFSVTPTSPFYVIAATYDSSTHALRRSVLVLYDSVGAFAGYRLEDGKAFECDGCGEARYEEGLGRIYNVLNGFEVPGFPYPLLLLDSGTVEGRALSLLTFAPLGPLSEYRIYEYVVTCILGEGG